MGRTSKQRSASKAKGFANKKKTVTTLEDMLDFGLDIFSLNRDEFADMFAFILAAQESEPEDLDSQRYERLKNSAPALSQEWIGLGLFPVMSFLDDFATDAAVSIIEGKFASRYSFRDVAECYSLIIKAAAALFFECEIDYESFGDEDLHSYEDPPELNFATDEFHDSLFKFTDQHEFPVAFGLSWIEERSRLIAQC